MFDFVNLNIGDKVKINVGSKYLILKANGFSSISDILLDENNWSDFHLELLHAKYSGGDYGLFAVFDKHDCRLYDVEVYKDTYNQWTTDFFIFKPSNYSKSYRTYEPDNSEIVCTCQSHDLFWYGCRCGAFKKERARKDKTNTDDDSDYYF